MMYEAPHLLCQQYVHADTFMLAKDAAQITTKVIVFSANVFFMECVSNACARAFLSYCSLTFWSCCELAKD